MGSAALEGFGSGGGVGGVLTVTAPAGVTVEVSKDGKKKSKTSNAEGIAVFKGLATGTWTLTIRKGAQTSTKSVEITADYSAVIAFFAASISVTFPAGSTCSCSDGTTTLTAPNTSGSHTFVVPNTGTWTVSCTDGSETASEKVSITADGQSKSVNLDYLAYVFKSGSGFNANVYKKLATNSSLTSSNYTVLNYSVSSGNTTLDLNSYANGNDFCPVAFDIDLSKFNTMYIDAAVSKSNGSDSAFAVNVLSEGTSNLGSNPIGTQLNPSKDGVRQTFNYNVKSITTTKRIVISTWNGRKTKIYNIWFK